MRKNKKSGPSCLGSLVLFAVIVIGLKFLYDSRDAEVQVPEETDSYTQAMETSGDSNEQGSLYDKIYKGLSSYAAEITFDYDCTDELFDTFAQVCADHPEMFWLNGSGTSRKTTRGEAVTVVLTPEPILTVVDILKCEDELEAAVNEILSAVDPVWSDYEKILYIHDLLVNNTEYDTACADAINQGVPYYSLWQSSSVYGCLVNNSAVCSGYSAAFQLLMNELDIPCIRVSGKDRDNGTLHEWNCVCVEGDWYYIDVTWDDPAFADADSVFVNTISHEYFLIPEDVLLRTHIIKEDETPPECTEDKFSYYVYNNRYLEKYDFEAVSEMILEQIGNDIIEIRFGSAEEAETACNELFKEKQFYNISGITATEIAYTSSETGLLRIRVTGEE